MFIDAFKCLKLGHRQRIVWRQLKSNEMSHVCSESYFLYGMFINDSILILIYDARQILSMIAVICFGSIFWKQNVWIQLIYIIRKMLNQARTSILTQKNQDSNKTGGCLLKCTHKSLKYFFSTATHKREMRLMKEWKLAITPSPDRANGMPGRLRLFLLIFL